MLAVRISGIYLNSGVLPETALGKDKQRFSPNKEKDNSKQSKRVHMSGIGKTLREMGQDLVLRKAHELSY